MPNRPRPEHVRGGHEPKKHHADEHFGFAAFGLRPELLHNIERLGWLTPSPIQAELIPLALQGYDLFGAAQTGTGKTGAFALPILEKLASQQPAPPGQPYCLILAPTRELVQQIETQFAELGRGTKVRSISIFGGVSDRPQITALNAGVEVVAAAPGRLLDIMGQGWINFASLQFCVLDEADRMFDMGFINDIRKILNRMPSRKQTLLLSATLPPAIKKLAAEFLHYPREVRIGHSAPPEKLKHELWQVGSEDKPTALVSLVTPEIDSALVFCRTRSRADSLARRLAKAGESVAALHSDRTQTQRDRALAKFKSGEVRVLVATDVASRGLDVDGIQLVVNYDVPLDPEDYVHRVGRTARAKREGKAVTFCAPEEGKYLLRIEKYLGHKIERGTPPAGAFSGATADREERVIPRASAAPSRGRGGRSSSEPRTAEPRSADSSAPSRSRRGGQAGRGDNAGSGNEAPRSGDAASNEPTRGSRGRGGRSAASSQPDSSASPAGNDAAPATNADGPKRRRRGGRGRGSGAGRTTVPGTPPPGTWDDSVGE
jgi:ATP-dependent RNA helicase RhlE